jgi:hypothetical protein
MADNLPWALKGNRSAGIFLGSSGRTRGNPPGKLSAYTALALAIAVNTLIALGLRLWHLDYLSLWLDEAMTAIDSTLSGPDLWLSALTDKPPLYYLITSAFWSPGDGEFRLRLPAALIGTLGVAVSGYLGKAVAGWKGAATLSFFFAISMVNIRYSQEARQYILLTLGWILVTSSLYLIATRPGGNRTERRLDLAAFGVGCLIMIHTHLIGTIYVILGLFSCILVLVVSKRLRISTVVGLGLCFLACLATLAPWLIAIVSKYSAGENSFNWLINPGAAEAVSIYMRDAAGGRVTFALAAAGFVIYAIRKDPATSFFFLVLAIAPPISLWILGHAKPVYMGRTVMLAHVPVLVGLLLLVRATERRWVHGLTMALVSAALVLPTARYFQTFLKEDWRGVANRISLARNGGIPVFVERIAYYKPIMFYLRDDVPDVYFITENAAGEMIAVDAKAGWRSKCLVFSCDPLARQVADDPEAVLYVARTGDSPDEDMISAFNAKLNHVTGKEYVAGGEWVGHNVFIYRFQRKEYPLAFEQRLRGVGQEASGS